MRFIYNPETKTIEDFANCYVVDVNLPLDSDDLDDLEQFFMGEWQNVEWQPVVGYGDVAKCLERTLLAFDIDPEHIQDMIEMFTVELDAYSD